MLEVFLCCVAATEISYNISQFLMERCNFSNELVVYFKWSSIILLHMLTLQTDKCKYFAENVYGMMCRFHITYIHFSLFRYKYFGWCVLCVCVHCMFCYCLVYCLELKLSNAREHYIYKTSSISISRHSLSFCAIFGNQIWRSVVV